MLGRFRGFAFNARRGVQNEDIRLLPLRLSDVFGKVSGVALDNRRDRLRADPLAVAMP